MIDMGAGDGADAVLEAADVLRQEPGLGEDPVFGVIGSVHLHQGAQQMRAAAGELAYMGVAFDGGEGGRHDARGEEVILAADLQDIGVLGDDPERMDALDVRFAERIVGPQPLECGVHRRVLGE